MFSSLLEACYRFPRLSQGHSSSNVCSERLMETMEMIYPDLSENPLRDPRICVYFQHCRWIFAYNFLYIGRLSRCYIPLDVWYRCGRVDGVLVRGFYFEASNNATPAVLDPLHLDQYFECIEDLLKPPYFESRVPFELYLRELWCLVRAFPCTHARQGRRPGQLTGTCPTDTSALSSGPTLQQHQIQAPDQVSDRQRNDNQTQATQVSDNEVIATTPATLYTPVHETWPGPVIP